MFPFHLRPLIQREILTFTKRNLEIGYRSPYLQCTKPNSTWTRILSNNSLNNSCGKTIHLRYRSSNLIFSRKYKPLKMNKLVGKIISWKTVFSTLIFVVILSAYMNFLRERKREAIRKEKYKSIGKAKIGGNFKLVNQNNVTVTNEDLLGKWLLIYFGFTHCPDICPDEIEKMVKVVDLIDSMSWGVEVKPIFITVDPERDTPSAVGQYVKEFSEKIIGLTGTQEEVEKACKAFRVYFSAGPRDSDNDYIVDHSIILYFVGPDGSFIDYFPQIRSAEQIVKDIESYMKKHNFLKPKGILDKLNNFLMPQ